MALSWEIIMQALTLELMSIFGIVVAVYILKALQNNGTN